MITKPATRETDTVTPEEPTPLRQHYREETVQESQPPLPSHESLPKAAKRRSWKWLVILALGVAAWYYYPRWRPWVTFGQPKPAAWSQRGADRVVPVRTAGVVERDMDLFLNALGTVTAFKTVTLKSRVDGELVKVAFTEGQPVEEGDLLAEIDPRPYQFQLDIAEGKLTTDEATLNLARITLARGKELFEKKSIAKQQLDEEAAQVAQLEGTVETDRGMVDNARLQLNYCRIVSPITGRIGLRLVDQGNIVHASDILGMAVITQLQPIAVVFPISQDEIPRVQQETRVNPELTVFAYDRGFNTKLATGKLAAIDNQVDATTGTVKLKAVFDNKDGMLFPNQFVNARLLVSTRKNAIIVPTAAVQRGPSGAFVYVVGFDDKVETRSIAVGPTEGAMTAIDDGLTAGEIVVTDGVDKLSKGTKITTLDKPAESNVSQASHTPKTDGERKKETDTKGAL